jgi:uncharacterized damage-inducible protein DinB
MNQGVRLAIFADQVRESTIKRFRLVKVNDRGWRPGPGRLSFVDHLEHLVDCDEWILAILEVKPEPDADVKPGDGDVQKWDQYMSALEEMGKRKVDFFEKMTDEQLDCVIELPGRLGKIEKAMLILRENLEHEIQHRGSVQVMLNQKND